MIKVVKVDEKLIVSFNYDANIVNKIKSLPTRKYLSESKAWEVPQSSIKQLIELFGENLSIDTNVDIDYKAPKYDFEKELSFIKDETIRIFAEWALSRLPNYFYTVAASSTGKYHPAYALGEGGLVRHTIAAVRIANELFQNDTVQNFTDLEKDVIITSLLLHDGLKHGKGGANYTVATHPVEVTTYLIDEYWAVPEADLIDEVVEIFESDIWDQIQKCIESHMGQWNTDYKTKEEILPLPEIAIQKFTHLCDYLASRKILEVNFNVEG